MTTSLILIAGGFIAVTVVFFWLLLRVLRTGLERSSWDDAKKRKVYGGTVIGLVVWALFLSAWALSGMGGRFDLFPLNAAPVLIIPLVAIVVVTFSGKVKQLLPLVSQQSIIYLQVFRVFVEILLWALFVQNLLPEQMTFEGLNFDIVSGLTAPLAAIFLVKSRAGLIVWNLVCLGLLINIVTVAILSMPGPFRMFDNEPANTIVFVFPYILLPGMLVPLAYGLSFLSIRKVSLTSFPL
jgi:hypothetical protein